MIAMRSICVYEGIGSIPTQACSNVAFSKLCMFLPVKKYKGKKLRGNPDSHIEI